MSNGGGIIRIHISGKAFQGGRSNLSSVIKILSGYEQSFQYCINLASYRLPQKGEPPVNATLALQSTQPGTLTAETILDSLPALAPMLPQIVGYSWDIYQKAQELIKVASMFFNRHERPVPMQQNENSPGAVNLNIENNGIITITPDVFSAATVIHKELGAIAKEVGNRHADRVTIESKSDPELIDINRDNHKLFDLPQRHFIDEESIEIECGIYSFNKHSLNGRLEFMEDETARVIPFKVEDGSAFDYASGLTADRSTVTATREMKINALGEKTITRFHLLDIKNYREPSQNDSL